MLITQGLIQKVYKVGGWLTVINHGGWLSSNGTPSIVLYTKEHTEVGCPFHPL